MCYKVTWDKNICNSYNIQEKKKEYIDEPI